MQKKFIVFNDPSHGWAKIPRSLLWKLGIADKISRCSYQRGVYVYLEEDCDLTLFIEKYEKLYGFKPEFVDRYSDKSSKIRSYNFYSP